LCSHEAAKRSVFNFDPGLGHSYDWIKASFQYFPLRKMIRGWNGQERFFVLKPLVPTQSLQDKEKLSCPFQSTDNFPEWKIAFNVLHQVSSIIMRAK
jgi:hypothetical protein